MKKISLAEITAYVNDNISRFHDSRVRRLQEIKLADVLRKKNPYLFRAKNLNVASDLIQAILDAYLSSSEEELFGQFLEDLALFIAGKTLGAHKSAAEGIDMEFQSEGIHYLVSVKSGVNWGNNAQQNRQEEAFKKAARVIRQSSHAKTVESVLGCCYGRTRTTDLRGYRKIVGQNFWHFISGNPALYTDIIEPLGHRAKEHNDHFSVQRAKVVNTFTQQFMSDFCVDGAIDWTKLVEYNSGNLDSKSAIVPH